MTHFYTLSISGMKFKPKKRVTRYFDEEYGTKRTSIHARLRVNSRPLSTPWKLFDVVFQIRAAFSYIQMMHGPILYLFGPEFCLAYVRVPPLLWLSPLSQNMTNSYFFLGLWLGHMSQNIVAMHASLKATTKQRNDRNVVWSMSEIVKPKWIERPFPSCLIFILFDTWASMFRRRINRRFIILGQHLRNKKAQKNSRNVDLWQKKRE